MSDDGRDEGRADGVPDTDPRHIDPAGDVADLFESGEMDVSLGDDTDREDLEEWLKRAESGEFGADPGVEATVRIVRALLDDTSAGGGES
jgi:hypothetical protein